MVLAAQLILEFQLLVFARDDPEKMFGSILDSDFLTMKENLSSPERTSQVLEEGRLAAYSASSTPSKYVFSIKTMIVPFSTHESPVRDFPITRPGSVAFIPTPGISEVVI